MPLANRHWDDWLDDADQSVFEMPYTKPAHALNQVDRAGEAIARAPLESPEFEASLPVFWNWRASHAYPQNTFYVTLRRRAHAVNPDATVSQRLKRRRSVLSKLIKNQKMELSQMQDIAGCRAVMTTMAELDALMAIYKERPIRSELVRSTNYIEKPRPSGYRGIHLMYRFNGRASAAPWNKLRVEMQFRTALQHSWATAVEAVDLFTNQRLKSESGLPEWQSFFALVAAINAVQEGTNPVPGIAYELDTIIELVRDCDNRIHALEALESFSGIMSVISARNDAYWYVVITDPTKGTVSVESYTKGELQTAQTRYRFLVVSA